MGDVDVESTSQTVETKSKTLKPSAVVCDVAQKAVFCVP